ncbi:hypothetical protein POUND7_007755 [Theobroma cacao]
MSKTSPPAVTKAYLSQFQEDFSSLLKFRSQELAPNGRVVLIFNGRQTADPTNKDTCYTWDLLAEALSYLVSQGLIDKDKLDSFNAPTFTPSQEEVEDLVEKEGSFTIEFIDTIKVEVGDAWASAESRAKNVRAFSEPWISHQFGEEIMDKLYEKVTQIVVEDYKLGKQTTMVVNIVAVLKKKDI